MNWLGRFWKRCKFKVEIKPDINPKGKTWKEKIRGVMGFIKIKF